MLLAAFGSWQLFAMHQAVGGSPPERVVASPNRESALAHESTAKPTAALALSSPPSDSWRGASGPLDLRPPTTQPLADDGVETDALGSVADGAHRKWFLGQSATRLEKVTGAAIVDSVRVAQPASTATGGHIMSPMETLAHNFRQQGLPLARLFENKDSLVHLGLDQKGKPGLWVVHRLH